MTLLISRGIPTPSPSSSVKHTFLELMSRYEKLLFWLAALTSSQGDDITAGLVVESDLREARGEILKINSQRWGMKQLMSPNTTLQKETRN